MTPPRILGVDPGLNLTGYAVIESHQRRPRVLEAGVIRAAAGKTKADMAQRLTLLYDGMDEIIQQFHPQIMVVEQLYAHYQHPRTAILMGHARGVLLLAGAKHGMTVRSYAATRIKRLITGSGRAPKSQVQRAVQQELGLASIPEPPDVADALAVALCEFHRSAAGDGERNS